MYINILGYGITNKALVILLNKQGIVCKIYDDKYQNDELDSIGNTYQPLRTIAKLYAMNPHGDKNLAIISPGIPPHTPFLDYFQHIISEYDFIFHIAKGLYSIWVSGTNGKTTTTEMLACMLGAKSGGNIGVPLATLFMQDYTKNPIDLHVFNSHKPLHTNQPPHNHKVYDICTLQDSKTIWVLETSSFALHYTYFALPNLYILLPLSQDHISWHGSFEAYITDKLKPLTLMNYAKNPKQHYVLLPKELMQYEIAQSIIAKTQANIFLYADSKELYAYLQCDKQYWELFKEPFRLDFMVAASGMRFGNIPFDIEHILKYKVGAYRMEEHKHNGLLFVNDSKATNPHAVLSALNTYKAYAIYLILGGDSKGAEMDILYPFLQTHAIKVFSIGQDGGMIAHACKEQDIWVQDCITLHNAMQAIYKQLQKDYCLQSDSIMDLKCKVDKYDKLPVIMLSPACASLDQYTSYQQRGEDFKQLIKAIFI